MQKVNTNTSIESKVVSDAMAFESAHDFKNAVLLVSLVINLFFLVGWVTLEVMSRANGQTVASLLQ